MHEALVGHTTWDDTRPAGVSFNPEAPYPRALQSIAPRRTTPLWDQLSDKRPAGCKPNHTTLERIEKRNPTRGFNPVVSTQSTPWLRELSGEQGLLATLTMPYPQGLGS